MGRKAATQAATPVDTDAPVHNTRARKRVKATAVVPLAANTRPSNRAYYLKQPTKTPSKEWPGYAAAVEKPRSTKRL